VAADQRSRYARKFQAAQPAGVEGVRPAARWLDERIVDRAHRRRSDDAAGGRGSGLADLGFTGTIMPPADSGVPPLSAAEVVIGRWIDQRPDRHGAARDEGGWFLGDLRPTLEVGSRAPAQPVAAVGDSRGIADALGSARAHSR
jgi:hypothetical protein